MDNIFIDVFCLFRSFFLLIYCSSGDWDEYNPNTTYVYEFLVSVFLPLFLSAFNPCVIIACSTAFKNRLRLWMKGEWVTGDVNRAQGRSSKSIKISNPNKGNAESKKCKVATISKLAVAFKSVSERPNTRMTRWSRVGKIGDQSENIIINDAAGEIECLKDIDNLRTGKIGRTHFEQKLEVAPRATSETIFVEPLKDYGKTETYASVDLSKKFVEADLIAEKKRSIDALLNAPISGVINVELINAMLKGQTAAENSDRHTLNNIEPSIDLANIT